MLAAKVIDVLRLDVRTPERQVVEAILAAMRRQDARDDSENVEQFDRGLPIRWAGGRGVADVLSALSKGQVEEILLSTSLKQLARNEERELPFENSSSLVADDNVSESVLAQARETGARARLIEGSPLLDDVGGVGARLRFRG